VSTDRVYVAEGRYDPVKKLTTLHRALNSAFFIVASRRGWRPNFPHKGRSMFRVCSEQPMQYAGAAAGQAYDKEGFADFLGRNIRVELPVAVHLQARAQSLQNIGL